ncbi:collagen alpha-1(XII) chain-like isoform X2 [Xiphophorus maculatus]|uniref:collagen alpha-1(XII) chain-like isoform X2 n=1 Tax=Xiphophorus maculatus TaxID=8083 RepID=UPI000C6EFE1D|nr:collagen alpha-1(XII) chain-like isoform X2 [Xiphophorus maculatus]
MDFYKVAFLLGAFICTGLRADQPHNAVASLCEISKVDIVMLVDGSESISNREFCTMKAFISQVVQNLPIGPNQVQIGLTQFSTYSKTELDLNSHNNNQTLLQAIDAIQHMKGLTNTGRGLDHVLKHNFQPGAGMRPDSKKKVVLITDGESTDKTEIPAQNLKDSGIEIYVIGVGSHVHSQHVINQLRTIASEDTENHLYLFSTYQSFYDAAINISRNLCHDATNLEKQGLQADQTNSTGFPNDD